MFVLCPRRHFLRRAAASCSLLAVGGCSRRTPKFVDGLEGRILDLAAKHQIPGVSVAVVRGARIVWSQGLGVQDRTSNTPVTASTVFEAASMSKPVFAYAVMKLRERRVLDLDTPLTHYTTQRFLQGDPALDLITARHVLAHTSGFQDIRSRENPLRIHFKPGSKWQYSGEAYAYLQSVVTKLTGRVLTAPCGTYEMDLKVCGTDFDAFMRANVLEPLGMTASGYVWRDELAARLARPHDEQGRPLALRKYTPADAARYGSMGGLLTTANDYARFLIAIMDPKPADAFRLRSTSIAEMLTPQVRVETGPGYSILWALGWKVSQSTEFGVLISHGGDQAGFHSLAEMSPDRKSGYVILTNGELGWKLIQELAPELARRVHA